MQENLKVETGKEKRNVNGKRTAADEEEVQRGCKYCNIDTRKMLYGKTFNGADTILLHSAPVRYTSS